MKRPRRSRWLARLVRQSVVMPSNLVFSRDGVATADHGRIAGLEGIGNN